MAEGRTDVKVEISMYKIHFDHHIDYLKTGAENLRLGQNLTICKKCAVFAVRL